MVDATRQSSPGRAARHFCVEHLESRQLMAVDVLTYRNDGARDGANLVETALTTADVNATQFGKLFTYPVDGYVYAQPLVKTNVTVPGLGTHDVVYVATEADSVYAFDANSNAGANAQPLWKVNFTDPANGVTTVPVADVLNGGIGPQAGITSTPVIDPATNTMYVVAMTKGVSGGVTSYVQRLHALDLATGAEKFGGPVVIDPTILGSGDGSVGGYTEYDALRQNQRPALTLANGVVYVASASFGDNGPYHGWIVGYSAATLQQVSAFLTTPDGGLGGIWQSGSGAAVDSQGNMYWVTGNGTFDADTGGNDYGDTAIKLAPDGTTVSDFFTPFNQDTLDAQDADLGSGGITVLPDSAGSADHPHIGVFAGKEGRIYLLDLDDFGGFNAVADQVVQELPGAMRPAFDTPAFYNGHLYYAGVGDVLKSFPVSNAHIGTATSASQTLAFTGASPMVSANGATNGIVWLVNKAGDGHAVMYAYDASDVTKLLYTSDAASNARDALAAYMKFNVPTIANGKVYVATQTGLSVFGELPVVPPPPPPPIDPTPTVKPTAAVTVAPRLTSSRTYYYFTVTYYDTAAAIDPTTLSPRNVTVAGPNHFSATATLASYTKGRYPTTYYATYCVRGPGGKWRAGANGYYYVTLAANQVKDANAQYASAGGIGTFAVKITSSSATVKKNRAILES